VPASVAERVPDWRRTDLQGRRSHASASARDHLRECADAGRARRQL